MIFYIFLNPFFRYAMLAEFSEFYRYAMLAEFSEFYMYAMLEEFFDSMEVANRLLQLHKTISSFHNICPQVKTMTHKYFSV